MPATPFGRIGKDEKWRRSLAKAGPLRRCSMTRRRTIAIACRVAHAAIRGRMTSDQRSAFPAWNCRFILGRLSLTRSTLT